MLNKKMFSILLFVSIISCFISFILLFFYTIPNEIKEHISMDEMLNNVYCSSHYKNFNYINGLWLMFIGIFCFCFIGILDIPKKEQEIRILLIKKIIKKL